MHLTSSRRRWCLICLMAALASPAAPAAARDHGPTVAADHSTIAGSPAPGSVQSFLDRQPGALKRHRDGKYTAAQAIEGYAAYYSLNPHILLALLELDSHLLSEPKPATAVLNRPFGMSGPLGFVAQIDWATREIRAGFGPYTADPVVQFSDGTTATISRKQDPSLVAVQRFLAAGHTQAEWKSLADGYLPLFQRYFGDEPLAPTPTATPTVSSGFLGLPWAAGARMIHSSYFDHVYPTVDQGSDGNDFMLNYLGHSNLSYNTHDGHDFYFPDQPIGTPIIAAAPGMAYAFSTPGNGVVIRHGGALAGYETVYWHLDQFDAKFQDAVDAQVGVPVAAGDVLGTSGKSGFTDGGAHLHFEVRHNGRELDPYGWYGGGADPCAAWVKCEASVWLWNESLRGFYDFTPPDAVALPDTDPPVGTLTVRQPGDPSLLVHFDHQPVASIGSGFPEINASQGGMLRYSPGVFGEALTVPAGVDVTYPISGNVELDAGTIAVWANLSGEYPATSTNRHYLFAASENPGDSRHNTYTNTLTLRRQVLGGAPEWNFWTVDAAGIRHDLVVSDTLQPGWHHFAVSWSVATKTKRLFIDGVLAASASGIALPAALGNRLELGRWTNGYGEVGRPLDELAVYPRALSAAEVAELAARRDPLRGADGPVSTAAVTLNPEVKLDTNAIDAQGGIVSVQLRRDDEPWGSPLPYYDSYRWSITGTAGLHTFGIRYWDRANNSAEVTTTVRLANLPVVAAVLTDATAMTATLAFSVTSGAAPLMVQVSSAADFAGAAWQPLGSPFVWQWPWPGAPEIIYVRFRDADGVVSQPQLIGRAVQTVWLPLVVR